MSNSTKRKYTNSKSNANLIHKYNSYLQSDFFTNYKQIDEQLKILFQTEYTFTIINNPNFVKNIP